MNNIKLGAFVLAGVLVLIIAFYMIGSKKNVFGNTIEISAIFYNVNGLMPGNNVRYGGIDIGTVKKVVFENDNTILVKMVIEKKMIPYIKKNAIASIGTDGLMGNKLVSINAISEPSNPIQAGDVLMSVRPVESDEMIRTLSKTNDNLFDITSDLKKLTGRLDKNDNLLSLITDTSVTENLRHAILSIKEASDNANAITHKLNKMLSDIDNGQGVIGKLVADTAAANKVDLLVNNLQIFSDTLNTAVDKINVFANKLNSDRGTVHAVLTDTVMKNNLQEVMSQLKVSSYTLEEDLKALQKNFLFRKYFRQKEKNEKK
jgi:phospholipid/cholesterol/gamma-HCH transport system substrate-binding protein